MQVSVLRQRRFQPLDGGAPGGAGGGTFRQVGEEDAGAPGIIGQVFNERLDRRVRQFGHGEPAFPRFPGGLERQQDDVVGQFQDQRPRQLALIGSAWLIRGVTLSDFSFPDSFGFIEIRRLHGR